MFNTIITKEVDCPECFKKHTDMPYRYIDILNEEKEIIGHMALGLSVYTKECLAHLVFKKWSKSSFRSFKTAFFSAIVPGLRDLGIKKMVAVHSTKDKDKWIRFVRLMNFSEPEEFLYTTMEI